MIISPASTPYQYIGRFAPSPSGPLHAGSITTALASWLDARAHGGRWLVRIEDIDTRRCRPDWVPVIFRQLARCGMQPDEPPVWQSEREALYQSALAQLRSGGHTYVCDCSRRGIQAAYLQIQAREAMPPAGELLYPGTCRTRQLKCLPGRSVRLYCGRSSQPPALVEWFDRRLGPQHEDITQSVGDFVLKRRDGLWAYQLAVVVDDAALGITHVVRGEDLASNTARQIYLQKLLGCAPPHYLHTPLVLDSEQRKLSKHHGAPAVCVETPEDIRSALQNAAKVLRLSLPQYVWERTPPSECLSCLIVAWKQSRWFPINAHPA
ncbi:MAG: tRNA glutamyl-Q(34) synthetase GluQRS [Burkholderiales bacterium]